MVALAKLGGTLCDCPGSYLCPTLFHTVHISLHTVLQFSLFSLQRPFAQRGLTAPAIFWEPNMSSLAACYLQTLAKLPRTLATLPNADENAAKERENTDRVVDKYLLHPCLCQALALLRNSDENAAKKQRKILTE